MLAAALHLLDGRRIVAGGCVWALAEGILEWAPSPAGLARGIHAGCWRGYGFGSTLRFTQRTIPAGYLAGHNTLWLRLPVNPLGHLAASPLRSPSRGTCLLCSARVSVLGPE